MKKMILTTIVTLMSLKTFASQTEFTTCYVSLAVPSSTKNVNRVVGSIPSYGVLGTWGNNLGVVSSIIKRERNVTLVKENDVGNISSFTVRLDGIEARPSVQIKAAIKSSVKAALDTLRKNTPEADQKFLSVFMYGCSATEATDYGSIE